MQNILRPREDAAIHFNKYAFNFKSILLKKILPHSLYLAVYVHIFVYHFIEIF